MRPQLLPQRRRAALSAGVLAVVLAAGTNPARAAWSAARTWDEAILSAIRIDTPNPPVHARNLFHLSAAMYDAWAAYDPQAVGYLYRGKAASTNVAADRDQTISYAAWNLLKTRYSLSVAAATTLPALDAQLAALGYDTNNLSADPTTPAGLGNLIANTVSAYFMGDGSFQALGYADLPASLGGYKPVNAPLDVGAPGVVFTNIIDVNEWQPLAITNSTTQNGIVTPRLSVQKFVGSQWLGVQPFALARTETNRAWIDPGPPPRLNGDGDAVVRSQCLEVIAKSGMLTPDDGATIDISPGASGNNTLGTNDGHGRPLNPVTGQPYAPNVVLRGDFARVLAEFWADGPNSETPPGHWNVIANDVADSPGFSKRIGGTGPVVDDLEWDIKVYFALNGAVHDAACAAWSLKREYNGWRPVSMIRYMGQSGQSSDPTLANYSTNGIPLVPGSVELVTTNTAAPGGRHEGLAVGSIAIHAWAGNPADPTNTYAGVHWIEANSWDPYQKKTFVTPAFPGYSSGHSTFSRAGAEVLAAVTGSQFFPGGMATYSFASNHFLQFERGPSQNVQLQWATYYDAADQAGISRLYGGIHVSFDDLSGRINGSKCGLGAWALARQYYDGSITNAPFALAITNLGGGLVQVRSEATRGMYYTLQSAPAPGQPFTDLPGGGAQATDAYLYFTNSVSGPATFFRASRSLQP